MPIFLDCSAHEMAYLHEMNQSSSKQSAMHYDDYDSPLLPGSNKDRRYFNTFTLSLITIDPANDKTRLFRHGN